MCVCVRVFVQVSKLLPDASRGERRRQPSRAKKMRYLEERKAAKEHRLGRGRGRGEAQVATSCTTGRKSTDEHKNKQ